MASTAADTVQVTVRDETPAKAKQPSVSLRGLYRYATFQDGLYLAAGSFAVFVSGVNQPLQLVVFGRLMDSFNITEREAVKSQVFFFAGMYALLGLQQIFSVSVQTACFSTVAARQAQRMRLAHFRALARRPMAYFDAPNRDAGALASSIMEKAALVQAGLGDDLAQLLQRVLAFVVGFFTAMYFCWQLALVSFAAVPLLAAVVGVANVAYARATKNSSNLLDAATSTPLEAVGAIRTVHAYGREMQLLDKYTAAVKGARLQGLAQGRAKAYLEAVTTPIMFVMFGGCLWYGSSLVSGDMEMYEHCRFVAADGTRQDPDPARCQTGGDVLTGFLNVIFGFMGTLQALPSLSSLAAAKVSAEEIFREIDAKPDEIDAFSESGEVPAKRATGAITLKDVTFAYPARREVVVYNNLCLTIDAGQTVALAGPSGCGKSTLVALLERWYDVDGGALLLDGADVRSLSVRWLRSQIGLVSQEPVLFSGSIGWNIGLGAGDGGSMVSGAFGPSDEASVMHAAKLANAHAFVSEMPSGYATEVGEKGVQLSGGQKQRIAIARALVREPPILVLDEATSALDAESERVVQAALDELLAGGQRTTIVIAHRLSTIRNADKIAVVSGGVVVEEGPHDDLVARDGGVYKVLVEAQAGTPSPSASRRGSAASVLKPVSAVATALEMRSSYSSVPLMDIHDAVPAKAAAAVVAAAADVYEDASDVLLTPDTTSVITAAKVAEENADVEQGDQIIIISSSRDADIQATDADTADEATADSKAAKKKAKAKLSKDAKRWVWSQVLPELYLFPVGLLGASITGLGNPLIGFLMAQFITVFYSADVAQMQADAARWGVIFLAMGLVQSIGALLRQIAFSIISETMVLRVRTSAFSAILRQPVGWFDASPERTAGALANRLAADCYAIKSLTGERAGIAVSQAAVLIFGLYISFSASWHLTLCLFATIPFIVLPVIVQAKVVQGFSERATAAFVAAGQTASETLLQLRTIAAFGLEQRSVERFQDELRLPLVQDIRKGVALGIGSGCAQGVILFGAALQYLVGGVFYDLGLVEFGDIMRCLLVLIFMAFGFTAVSRDASDRAEAMVAAGRVHTLVTTRSPIDALKNEGVTPTKRANGTITLKDVTFAYPARREVVVYNNLCLTIDAGQTVALAGPSGCGKSTLVALLERWYDVDGGALLLDGADVRSLSVRWLRSQIGLVSQEPVLFSGSIGWNIGLGAGDGGSMVSGAFGPSDEASVMHAAKLANAHAFVSEMPSGYATEVGEKGVQLSGGQKQRIAIARALVREPPILVLDEATSALDAESERVVQAALDELLAGGQRTTIVIAHRLSTIRNADKIAVVSGGVVVEEGPHDDLVARDGGVYKALVAHSACAAPDP